MNYLVFSPFSTDCTNAATLLDYSLRIIANDLNAKIFFVYLDSYLADMNDMNIHNSPCRGMEIKFDNWLIRHNIRNKQIEYIPISNFVSKLVSLEFNYRDLNGIKKITYRGVNIGYGVVSSYVSFFRNINPVFDNDVVEFFNRYLNYTATVVEGLLNICDNYHIDTIVSFNGRFATLRTAVEVAKVKNIKYITLEHVSLNKYETIKCVEFHDCMPHSISNATKESNRIWKNISGDNKLTAKSFFEKRAVGEIAGDRVYIDKQIDGTLPKEWKDYEKNIVFFSSSEDEFFSIDEEWEKLRLYKNQEEAVCKISEICVMDPNIHIYLRIHPHLIGLPYRYAKFESAYALPNVTVIPAESPVSTYELIRKCDICITMGSTTGAEATYWGAVSILLGGSLYHDLDVAYCPKDEIELREMLNSDLCPKPQINALKFAAFVCGIDRGTSPQYVNYKPIRLTYRGRSMDIPSCSNILNSPRLYILAKIIFRLLDIRRKRTFIKHLRSKLIIESHE